MTFSILSNLLFGAGLFPEHCAMINTIKQILTRDLKRLRAEIEAYQDEGNLWKTEANIANAAGNLCLHLVGNLHMYVGKIIGQTDYVRNRELEFAQKDVPRQVLIAMIDDTTTVVTEALDNMSDDLLDEEYPILVFEGKSTTSYRFFLVHLTTHLTYHLGQINYHRRLLDGAAG
jgi:uncharacterized damage-inducible protein DinB